ncbi:MAG: B12-binding domain-containing radical SAM protein [Bacteroidales bacterium]|nr:B12-binding domain-containing radical SAM protein [Bacteroidales bacterium]MCF8396524.1 B12-binding domain-containing radical SAM protein [Bacteroidales bacterium]
MYKGLLDLKKPRLLLVNPVSRHKKGFAINKSSRFEPTGLGIVAALTPDNWEIELLDENFDEFEFREADLVALTAFTGNVYRAYELAGIYREKGIHTVLGGAHASMMPEEAAKYVDTVVVGEAEGIWPEVIKDYEAGKIKRLYEAERLPLNPPIPRRDLFNSGYIQSLIQTTRGCPMDCEFCSVTAFNGRKYRFRPVDEIVKELKSINRQRVFFVDDNIIGHTNASKDHAKDLFETMIREKIKVSWYSQTDMTFGKDPEMVKLAAKSGCRMVLIGFESEKAEELKNMRKSINTDMKLKYRKYLRNIHREGIMVMGTFIFGLDSDNVRDLYRRARFVNRSGADILQLTILTPFPGTKLYYRMKDEKRIIKNNYPEDWQHYHFWEVCMQPGNMSPDDLSFNMTNVWEYLYSKKNLRKLFLKSLFRTRRLNIFKWFSFRKHVIWAYVVNWIYKRITLQYSKRPEGIPDIQTPVPDLKEPATLSSEKKTIRA